MKHYLFLFVLLLTSFAGFAQSNGNGAGNGNQGSFVISEAQVIESNGGADMLEIRLSGQAANVWSYMSVTPTYTTRVSAISLEKVNGQANQGNGNTSLWRATVDAQSITDPISGEIELTVNGGPYCCNIPQGGIVVKIKPKK